ncbi:MAG: hypothetical protein DRI65_02155 [Chloroflexota bacterium]|nr:MAG: hypothetical protein DRI65_02155 [Chloroflexota bacterium]HDD61904.1 hypothetical protein [Chloroflexota bacterium]
MKQNMEAYQWTKKDKWLYWLSMVPFLVVFIGALLLLSTYSPWLAILEVVFYLLTCVFQAACCIGCPYRGKYCPALFGIYFGNILSGILYPKREFDQEFFEKNATAGEIMVLVIAVFPIYWVVKTSWWLLLVYLLLIAAHLVLFMPTQCEKCSYNETCPGGLTWRACSVWLRERREKYINLEE